MTAEIGSPAAAVASLPPEWQDWLAGNIVRGCSDPDILRSMTDSGFDEACARVAIAVVERRIAALTGVPVENGEPLQIPHHRPGGEYLPHHDYFDPQDEGSSPHRLVGEKWIATKWLRQSAYRARA